jgi:hypothetical protein
MIMSSINSSVAVEQWQVWCHKLCRRHHGNMQPWLATQGRGHQPSCNRRRQPAPRPRSPAPPLRTLASNIVVGVSEGFEKKLELVGTGYRAAISGQELTLNLGYSKPRILTVPDGIKVTVSRHKARGRRRTGAGAAGAGRGGLARRGGGAGSRRVRPPKRPGLCPGLARPAARAARRLPLI